MSLPSGLIFFLDFTYTGVGTRRLDYAGGESVYGGGVVGSQITGGVSLAGRLAEQSAYALNNGYSSPTGSNNSVTCALIASGTVGDATTAGWQISAGYSSSVGVDKLVRFDPDLEGAKVAIGRIALSDLTGEQLNIKDYVTISETAALTNGRITRRLTRDDEVTAGELLIVVAATGAETATQLASELDATTLDLSFVIDDDFGGAAPLGAVAGTDVWGLENNAAIPEIDIKVDSVAVTAKTKKLKAKWTPELAQDLNAYHNLDAEVELTSILSEHIALEIDQEILEDLVKGATASTLYWSRLPGKFLNRETGVAQDGSSFPDFTGNVSEWYETLVETINDVSAQIHRKTLRGGANFIVVSPEVANLLEFTAGFRGSVTHDEDRGQVGAVRIGSLSKKFDVYVDPYFPRNLVLAGRKGSSFLESGYVYAPYVPLQMTPTIFGTEDFVPRKGVMTRYAKKMVRPDMYGLVVITDLV
jgi:hypothetical protein